MGSNPDRFSGGGVLCQSASATVSNCVLTGNAGFYGGAATGGKLNQCIIVGNSGALGGGVANSVVHNCIFTNNVANGGGGGGAYASELTDCLFVGNFANYPNPGEGGGGTFFCSLYNCVLRSNSANFDGGGAYGGTLNNCTLVGNAASNSSGGAYSCNLNNCIVFYNQAPVTPNYSTGTQYFDSVLNHCCTAALPSSGITITNEPFFVNFTNGDLHLQSNSPCINAGSNAYVTNSFDLDGNPRIVGGTVDIGAYEFQNPTSKISYAWLDQYGLPIDGSADFTDPDQDGMNNWQEWIAGTNPTNAASVLKMLAPSNSTAGVEVSWLSVPNRSYSLFLSTNLAAPDFIPLATNIPGQTNTTTYVDTNATGAGPFFYRAEVLGMP